MRKALKIVIQFLLVLTFATLVGCPSPALTPTPTPTSTLPSPTTSPIVSPTLSLSPSPTPTTSKPTPLEAPSISIVQPPAGTYVVGTDNISVVVQVSGFDLFDKIGQANVPGEGHINYFIHADTSGIPQVAAPGPYVASAATSYTWTGLVEGVYTFSVELVNNDNSPLAPPVLASSTVTVFPG